MSHPPGGITRVGRLIVPLRNGGAGIALTMGRPVIVQSCEGEPDLLPDRAVGQLGTYFIPSGGSDQLGYVQRIADKGGKVRLRGRSLWYSFDYMDFGLIGPSDGGSKPANLVIWYTDGARRLLRWTCISYVYDSRSSLPHQPEWGVDSQTYGTRSMVPLTS